MALSTPNDLIRLALKVSGAIGVGQTPDAEQINDGLNILNLILAEWQLYRWIIYDLVDTAKTATAATSYTVGPAADFNISYRPDRIDAAFARLISTGADSYLYPFQAREGYDRVSKKAQAGVPESYYYDPSMGTTGTIYFWPVPASTYSLHIQCKAPLAQFASLTQPITLQPPYMTAMLWNLAAALRPVFGLPEDPQVSQRALGSLQALMNSIAQVPQNVVPQPGNRGGIYSAIAAGQQNDSQ